MSELEREIHAKREEVLRVFADLQGVRGAAEKAQADVRAAEEVHRRVVAEYHEVCQRMLYVDGDMTPFTTWY